MLRGARTPLVVRIEPTTIPFTVKRLCHRATVNISKKLNEKCALQIGWIMLFNLWSNICKSQTLLVGARRACENAKAHVLRVCIYKI